MNVSTVSGSIAAIQFNADEVFRIAERIENNAAIYYRNAADIVDEPDARSFFASLAEWEGKHEKKLLNLHQAVTRLGSQYLFPEPDNDVMLYLNALSDSVIFDTATSPVAKIGEQPSLVSVVEFALNKEKEAILYFIGLRDAMPDGLERAEVDRIVREEMKHVFILKDKLKEVSTW